MSAAFASKYWLGWTIFLLVSFLIPEVYSLAVHRPQGTLSDTIWRLEDYDPAKGHRTWNAFHFLFIAELLVIDVWLLLHFGWRQFT